MSKSYSNTINILGSENNLKKQIMGIITDSKGLEEPKDPSSCNVFKIYELLASDFEIEELKSKYKNGGFGYGNAKKELLELIVRKFEKPRKKFNELMDSPENINRELKKGSEIANEMANNVLKKVRQNLGLVRA